MLGCYPPPMAGTHDILGHEAVLQRLWGALDRDELHHAYLFEGPDGVGKHLVALRLAQAANCDGPAPRPCGVCKSCRAIEAGTHADVLEVGPDPDRKTPIISVDQIRELVRKTGYHRYTGRRRVVIVDPAEALQPASANALLKTLEEPPEGTGFVLIAHHARALLPTIVSRCQRVRFAAVPQAALAEWLERRGAEQPERLARLAMGRPGAAVGLAEGDLDTREALREQVYDMLNERDLGQIFELSKAMCSGERQQWRPRVDLLLDVIEDVLRDATVAAAGQPVALLDPEQEPRAVRMSQVLWPSGVQRVAQAIEDAREGLARNASGRTVVDALLTRLAHEVGPT